MRRFVPLLLLLVVAGCSLDDLPTPRATYAPVLDGELYARIAAIPGVTRVDVGWTNGFDAPNGYRGTIGASRTADDLMILDRALAMLRQGRPGASLVGIEVAREGHYAVYPSQFGLWSDSDFTARYGPQPGTGIPPRTPLVRTR